MPKCYWLVEHEHSRLGLINAIIVIVVVGFPLEETMLSLSLIFGLVLWYMIQDLHQCFQIIIEISHLQKLTIN